ncbi:MAG: pyrroline-5-carboxylate reductase [Candidatus Omnitrophica bacterium]|nr:pyrroline-5-carboxylate reductase [Candidatus Omnitrophota bacterium]
MKKNREIIGIIGYGNMGSVIGKKLCQKYQVLIFDKDNRKSENTSNVKAAQNINELITGAGVVILAVKPQDFDTVLREIKKDIDKKLIISIAAGIPTTSVEKILGKIRTIRVMPNLLIRIGRGITGLCKGKFATNKDLNFARKIFDLLGTTIILKENMMDADTAFLGSGPGFHFDLLSNVNKKDWHDFTQNKFIPQCAASGEQLGFSKQQAKLLAKLMAEGDLALLEQSHESPETLCSQVTSKGGTTEAGLKELKKNVKFLPKAAKAAYKRAKELSR